MAELKQAMADPDFVYVSGDDMGPSQWMSLHNIARTLTPEKMDWFKQYVKAMAALLPCGVCSTHFRKLVSDTLRAGTPEEALQWTIDVHNAVNKRLGKPVLTNAQALQAIRNGGKALRAAPAVAPAASANTCPALNTFGVVFMRACRHSLGKNVEAPFKSMTDQAPLDSFACTVQGCGNVYLTYSGLVYHVASEHRAMNMTMAERPAGCPLCEDSFLLINGDFCMDHYVLVHQVTKRVSYDQWLQNASERERDNRPAPRTGAPGAAATRETRDDGNLEPRDDGRAREETLVDLDDLDDDLDEQPESAETLLREAEEMMQGHVNKDLKGASVYLDLDFDNAEEYLRKGFSYEIVDEALKTVVSESKADIDMD